MRHSTSDRTVIAKPLPKLVTRVAPLLLRKGRAGYAKGALVRLPLLTFIFVCVFDPADQVLGAKVWLFVALWGATCIAALSASDEVSLPTGLLLCVLLFIAIPLLSILWYYVADGTQPYAGFGLLKGFLLVSVAIVIVANRVDVLPFLSATLTILALMTVAIFVALKLDPALLEILQRIGSDTGLVVGLFERSYGEALTFIQINVVTSPLLAISIPYYFDRAMSEPAIRSKLLYLALAAISVIGMLLVGSRNQAAVALLLPLFLWPLYTRHVIRNMLLSLGAAVVMVLPFVGRLRILLNPDEFSNKIKLTLLGDYAKIFSDPLTLILGQGLGAYYRWSTSGRPEFELTGENFYFNTEITYGEMVRYFGLPGAAIMVALLLFPVAHAFLTNTSTRQRALALGFLAYLGMSATNPLLLSSNGMLLFSVMLANTFQISNGDKYSSIRSGP